MKNNNKVKVIKVIKLNTIICEYKNINYFYNINFAQNEVTLVHESKQ